MIPKPNIVTKAEHSEYGPSGSKRWLSCPASIQMVRDMPKVNSGSNFYAEEGTAAHELAAYCLDEEVSAESRIGKTYNKKFVVDKEMAKQTQKYIDYVRGQETWDSQLLVECKLSLQHVQKDMFGTVDACIVSDSYLEIIDLKYGRGVVVEPKGNTQLMLYACGMLAHLANNGVTFEDDFEVMLTIAQPRAPHSEGPIRSSMVTIAALRQLQVECRKAVKSAESDDPSFGPGESQCMWCEASPRCRALADHNMKVAQLDFEEFTKPSRCFKEEMKLPKTLTREEIANILKHSKSLQNWLTNITNFAIEEMNRGKIVPGYKLVYGRSNRQFSDQKKVERTLLDSGVLASRLFGQPKFNSPAQMEKELNEDELGLITDLIIKPQGKVTIALDTDARAAVNPNHDAAKEWD